MRNTEPEVRPDLEAVYLGERAGLLRLGFLLTGSLELAEDAVQTAFVAAAARWPAIGDPTAYLRRVVVNQAADTHRRRFRELHRTRMLDAITEIPEVDETWAELRRLPTNQRAVVVLRFYADLPLVTIAELLDRPAATVRSDLHRALDRLRRLLR